MAENKKNTSKQNKNVEWKAIIFAIVAGIVTIAFWSLMAWFLCFRTVPKFTEKTLEIGKKVPSHVYDYVTGAPFMHDGYTVDVSKVRTDVVGDYNVIVVKESESYIYTLHVVDTKAPIISMLGIDENGQSEINEKSGAYYNSSEDAVVLELAQEYSVSDIVKDITDASDMFDLEVSIEGTVVAESSTYRKLEEKKLVINACGTYDLLLKASDASGNFIEKVLKAIVVDTKGPDIELPENGKYFAVNSVYTVDDIVTSVSDPSGVAEYHFVINGMNADSIIYTEIGSYFVGVSAIDELGNEIFTEIRIEFDESPELVGYREYLSVLRNSDFEITEFIRAFDNTDGNISDRIEIDDGGFNITVDGEYTVTYSVSDSHGLVTKKSAVIAVGEIDESNYALNEKEVQILTDYGYFSYEPLEADDYDQMISNVEPTLVNLLRRYSDGGYSFGSGFVYRVDADYVYFVTCYHVVKDMLASVEMAFWDEDETIVNVNIIDYERAASDSEVAMFKIPTSAIPADVLLDVKQMYVDEDIYDTLRIGQEIVAYSGHWSNLTPTIRKLYIKRMDDFFLDDSAHCIVTTHNTKGGMSGCPIVDLKGRLVGICEGYWGHYNYDTFEYEYEGYVQRIEGITELYNRVKSMASGE